tara:strand:- start:1185 stop:1496 length:312 start_codon:yes stop_codon:yes gene_type:complete
MQSLLREYIHCVLVEEIGRNYHTLDNDPYSWQDYPGIDLDIYPSTSGSRWLMKVNVEFDDSLSTSLMNFMSEADALSFARNYIEQINVRRMNSGIDTNTSPLQ